MPRQPPAVQAAAFLAAPFQAALQHYLPAQHPQVPRLVQMRLARVALALQLVLAQRRQRKGRVVQVVQVALPWQVVLFAVSMCGRTLRKKWRTATRCPRHSSPIQ